MIAQRYFLQATLETHEKPDGSDVTEADFAVDRFLQRALPRILGPDWPIISEETLAHWPVNGPHPRAYCSIDPIDGTSAFIRGEPIYTILMAWIIDGKTVAAVHAHPALDTVYVARKGHGAWKQVGDSPPEPLAARPLHDTSLPFKPRFLIKREGRNVDALLSLYDSFLRSALSIAPSGQPYFTTVVQSPVPRMADIAAGGADLYVSHSHDARPGKGAGVHDLAGWDLILREAGGALSDTHGRALDFSNPHSVFPAFFAIGDRTQREVLVDAHQALTAQGRFTPLP